ncbi:Vesicle-associated protein 4-2 isoform 2 [Theobroma cacao]|uniref:Vesicle-associated protein 4-2 isoform 2 n=1 Tax=Theobroma cacao TaxID=3641 RepID=A0A061GEX6_THECC|nr:Vesicle-associated protein 4-2 isoform 2 [Theobroma cacao]EOY28440.1 Vesicle-associated protein 4-2 isoform 2 [Theobroma cacao]
MAIETEQKSPSDGKVWGFFKLPFLQIGNNTSTTSSSSSASHLYGQSQPHVEGSNHQGSANSVSSVAKSLLPTRRRLKLDPGSKLYFPYEPGKQVRSAVRIKNTSKSFVAFKFQTTAPKSCFMRPPGAILAPGESIIATVFKFVEHPENNEKPMDQKSKVKFKIMSLKVKGPMDYVPECLFFAV